MRNLVALTALLVLAASCQGDEDLRTPPAADAVAVGSTSTVLSPEDPPVVIGGAPGADGHLPVRLNPMAWEKIEVKQVDDDPLDPYHELHTVGHDDFWFGVELHPETGPGWTGELGLFATDCEGAGICVRFDPDGGAGPTGPITADPNGEVEIEQLDGGFVMVFRNLVFRRNDGASFRVDTLAIET